MIALRHDPSCQLRCSSCETPGQQLFLRDQKRLKQPGGGFACSCCLSAGCTVRGSHARAVASVSTHLRGTSGTRSLHIYYDSSHLCISKKISQQNLWQAGNSTSACNHRDTLASLSFHIVEHGPGHTIMQQSLDSGGHFCHLVPRRPVCSRPGLESLQLEGLLSKDLTHTYHMSYHRYFGLTERIYCAIIKVALSRVILEGSSLKVAGSLWEGKMFCARCWGMPSCWMTPSAPCCVRFACIGNLSIHMHEQCLAASLCAL